MENATLLKEYVKSGVSSYDFRPWKIALLAVGLLLLVVGAGLRAFEGDDAPRREPIRSGVERPSDTSIPTTARPKSGLGPSSLFGDDPTIPPGVDLDPPGTSSVPTGPAATVETTGDASSSDRWSPAFLKNGFGFFIGFCVGFAIRTVLRLAALVVGLNMIVLVIFASLGWVEVHWDVMSQQFQSWVDGLGPEFKSIESFLLGRLPATGMTGLGLFTGLRRK
ncbi:MAG: hypothetical protein KDC38_03155 [Planctomycetes bacterium]|nr:hypothetical protein [Planctomycetota bacterium]